MHAAQGAPTAAPTAPASLRAQRKKCTPRNWCKRSGPEKRTGPEHRPQRVVPKNHELSEAFLLLQDRASEKYLSQGKVAEAQGLEVSTALRKRISALMGAVGQR